MDLSLVGRLKREAAVSIRAAKLRDVDALLRIEERAFPTDRLTRRDFRHAFRSATIDMLVAERDTRVVGYAQIHRRRGSRVARLATIAVDPAAGGAGIGAALAAAAEGAATAAGCERMRLEVRADNGRAIRLYRRAGYRAVERLPAYYEDGGAAERFEKPLA